MNAIRFAARVAFSPDRRHLWRQVSMIVASFVAAWACLLAIGLLFAVSSAYERSADRSPDFLPPIVTGDLATDEKAPPPDGAKLRLVKRGTVVDGRQVPTIWIEPLPGHENDPAIIPVGLESFPAPGEAVLSPGLIARGHDAEDFGWLSSDAGTGSGGTIGPEGLMAASEPLIFVRPIEGRTLATGTTPQYASSFGQSVQIDFESGEPVHGDFNAYSLDPELLPLRISFYGVLGFTLLPALVLLVSSSRARSGLRDERLGFMVKLGIREPISRAVLATEAGLLAITGALIGSITYSLASPFISRVPTTSITLLEGELIAPWWGPSLVVLSIGAVAAACGALGRTQRRLRRQRTPRPRLLFILVLGVALACLLLSAISPTSLALFTSSPRQASELLFGLGTLLTLVSLPLAIPGLAWLVSGRLSSNRRPTVWVAARRIRADAVQLSRIASVLGLLIVTASVATSAWAASRATQINEQSTSDSSYVMQASWRSPEPGDLSHAREALAAHGTDALVLTTQVEDDTDGPTPDTVVVDDCRSFVEYFHAKPSELCGEEQAPSFASFVSEHTGRAPAAAPSVDHQGNFTNVLVISREPLSHETVQKALGVLPGLNLAARPSDTTAPLPLQEWTVVGGIMAFLILGLASIREIGDRAVDDGERDRSYLRIGIAAPAVDLLTWIVMLLPLIIGMATAFIASVIIAYSGEVLSIANGNLIQLSVISVTTLALAGIVVAITIPVRRAMRPTF